MPVRIERHCNRHLSQQTQYFISVGICTVLLILNNIPAGISTILLLHSFIVTYRNSQIYMHNL